MLNEKAMIIYLIVRLIKKTLYKIIQTFLNHKNLLEETLMSKWIYKIMQGKTDLKNATGVDTSKLAAKSDLVELKAEIDNIDVDKLRDVPVDVRKLSNVVNNDVV